MGFKLTEAGKKKTEQYIREMEAKRKEILDAGKDTADETEIPTIEDIEDDIKMFGIDADGEHVNCWGVTDNYNADYALGLHAGTDFTLEIDPEHIFLYPGNYGEQSGFSDDRYRFGCDWYVMYEESYTCHSEFHLFDQEIFIGKSGEYIEKVNAILAGDEELFNQLEQELSQDPDVIDALKDTRHIHKRW